MRVLLDECVTRRLRREFIGHEVFTIEEAGFKGLKNGNLLRAAEGNYQVLVTVDRNMHHQQNIASYNIAVLVLAAKRNTYAALSPLMPQALAVLNGMGPGTVIVLSA